MSSSTQQCNTGFNHYAAMTEEGITYNLVFLSTSFFCLKIIFRKNFKTTIFLEELHCRYSFDKNHTHLHTAKSLCMRCTANKPGRVRLAAYIQITYAACAIHPISQIHYAFITQHLHKVWCQGEKC